MGTGPPTHRPFLLEAEILSRTRSPITSCSNWAKDNSTLSVSRPMEVVVLNCCVTEPKDTPCRSKRSTGLDVGEQAGESRSVERASREAAVVVAVGQAAPALVGLALDEGLGCLALGIKGVEVLLQAVLGGLAGVDGTAKCPARFTGHGEPPHARGGLNRSGPCEAGLAGTGLRPGQPLYPAPPRHSRLPCSCGL